MADIFLSYVREDVERARPLVQTLEARGWSVFWDENLTPGPGYRKTIQRELDEARCVVVLWSARSVDSTWVLDEADRGLRAETLISVLIEEVSVPLGFGQGQLANLVNWDAGGSHRGPRQTRSHEETTRDTDRAVWAVCGEFRCRRPLVGASAGRLVSHGVGRRPDRTRNRPGGVQSLRPRPSGDRAPLCSRVRGMGVGG